VGKAYIIRVLSAECDKSLVAHFFRPSYGFTLKNGSFLAKFSPLQNLKVAIYKGFYVIARNEVTKQSLPS